MMHRRIVALVVLLSAAACLAFGEESMPALKAKAEAAGRTATAAPRDYAANWMAAKAWRDYGDAAVSRKVDDWKTIAKTAGKEGMKYGEIATTLNPTGIEGWYYYGLSVGTYADGVSIVTAITQGLKGKTQKGFEMAYSTNKRYDNGGPILALGRFWQVLPGIAGRDVKKAEQLFTEYIALFGSSPDANSDAWFFRGELYKEQGKKAEARADLQKAASMGNADAAEALKDL